MAHGPLVLKIFWYHFFDSFILVQSSTEPVLAAEFHPLEKGNIVTCGKGQISFWTLEGGSLAKKTGIFDVSIPRPCPSSS